MKRYHSIIIGSGFSGIGIAIKLQKLGIDNFLILERDSTMGGTWQQNTYPGAAVDIPSQLYSFSFEPYNWSRLYAQQEEILKYTNHIIDKYMLREKCQLNTNVNQIKYNETEKTWAITSSDNQSFECEHVMFALGPLSCPSIPKLKGREKFKGVMFHSGKWDHSYDYTNKRVAVIGTAASAVQIIPAIAEKVKSLHAFQRTPHWVAERHDRHLTNVERYLTQKLPILQNAHRHFTYWMLESRMLGFRNFPVLMKTQEIKSLRYMKSVIKDKELRKKLTPDFTFGCKRVLLTSKYYPAFNRDNVFLETDGIEEINETGILTKTGKQIDVDLIVYATGYHIAENSIKFPIIGREGVTVAEAWKDGAHAYLGTTVPYLPNFFTIGGPNTGIGHTSFLFLLEAQLNYIVSALKKKKTAGITTVEVKAAVEAKYNDDIQEQLKTTVWEIGGCNSWYKTANGKNTIIYPNYSFVFWKDTLNFDIENYITT